MNEIYWDDGRFHCNNPEMEAAHQVKLASRLNSATICKYMQSFGFDVEIIAVTLFPERQFPKNLEFYPKGLPMSAQGFSLEEMGSGFAVCLGLLGYVLASQDLGGGLRVYGGSFRALLHPTLYSFLSLALFSKENKVYKKCPYFSGSEYLKCAINPSLPCSECEESPDSFRGHNFEWVEECDWTHKGKHSQVHTNKESTMKIEWEKQEDYLLIAKIRLSDTVRIESAICMDGEGWHSLTEVIEAGDNQQKVLLLCTCTDPRETLEEAKALAEESISLLDSRMEAELKLLYAKEASIYKAKSLFLELKQQGAQ